MKVPKPFDTINTLYHYSQDPHVVIAVNEGLDFFSVIAFGDDGLTRVIHDYEIDDL